MARACGRLLLAALLAARAAGEGDVTTTTDAGNATAELTCEGIKLAHDELVRPDLQTCTQDSDCKNLWGSCHAGLDANCSSGFAATLTTSWATLYNLIQSWNNQECCSAENSPCPAACQVSDCPPTVGVKVACEGGLCVKVSPPAGGTPDGQPGDGDPGQSGGPEDATNSSDGDDPNRTSYTAVASAVGLPPPSAALLLALLLPRLAA